MRRARSFIASLVGLALLPVSVVPLIYMGPRFSQGVSTTALLSSILAIAMLWLGCRVWSSARPSCSDDTRSTASWVRSSG